MKIGILFVLLLLVASPAHAAVKMCQGKRFTPCVCWQDVPTYVSYRPSERVCRNSNAAVILRGPMYRSFSVVVRDTENSDRFPDSSCSQNYCIVFKTQKIVYRTRAGVRERVNCLGARGTSGLFKKVVRITVKVSDIPDKNGQKDLRRYCLKGPGIKLN